MSLQHFSQILDESTQWVTDCEKWINQHGAELSPLEIQGAIQAGVRHPQKVRVAIVPHIPKPESGLLKDVNAKYHLLTEDTLGLTLHYGIFIRSDSAASRQLLIHELVHVAQFERFGGIRAFLTAYIAECIDPGYPKGPLEQEAIRTASEICSKPDSST